MKVAFADIPDEGLSIHLQDKSFVPAEVHCSSPVRAEIFLERNDSRVILSGELSVPAELACDRCLDVFDFSIESKFTVDFELVEQAESDQPGQDYHCQGDELDTIILYKPEIDISQVVAQQVLLALPMKQLCSVNCKGLCSKCGANLNDEKSTCRCQVDSDSPFNVLAQLK